MSEPARCRCGAYAKPELRRRGTNERCCSRCYDQSWAGVSDAEWEAAEFPRDDFDEGLLITEEDNT
jgi:hypothetical protein